MKVINHDGRLTLQITAGNGADVHRASGGLLPWNAVEALERWPEGCGLGLQLRRTSRHCDRRNAHWTAVAAASSDHWDRIQLRFTCA